MSVCVCMCVQDYGDTTYDILVDRCVRIVSIRPSSYCALCVLIVLYTHVHAADARWSHCDCREGGEGEGQFRTDRAGSIGKIATGRTLQEEEEASRQGLARSERAARSEIVKKAKVPSRTPPVLCQSKQAGANKTSYACNLSSSVWCDFFAAEMAA